MRHVSRVCMVAFIAMLFCSTAYAGPYEDAMQAKADAEAARTAAESAIALITTYLTVGQDAFEIMEGYSDEWWWTQAQYDSYHFKKDYVESMLTQVYNAWNVGNPSPISQWFAQADSKMAQGGMALGMGMYPLAITNYQGARSYYDSVTTLWNQLLAALLYMNDMADLHLVDAPFEELE